ncbi:MAG: redoxin family protein [Alphaproteobacteria bacterium]|nr:redoxin family protein [Alphaproteobacteria bacterium]
MTEHDPLTSDLPEPPPPLSRRVLGWVGQAIQLAVAFVLVLGVVGWMRSPALPPEAPDFALVDLQGHTLQLSELRGRPVVLSFWATWCGVCRAEMPSKEAFARAHDDVAVVGVAVDSRAAVQRYVGAEGLPFPNVIASREVVEAYGVEMFPTTVVLDAEGRVVWTHSGAMLRPMLELLAWWAR